jgi:hypothetical protein
MTRRKGNKKEEKNTLLGRDLVVTCCSIDLVGSDWKRHLLVGLPGAGPVDGRFSLASFRFRFVRRFAVLTIVEAGAEDFCNADLWWTLVGWEVEWNFRRLIRQAMAAPSRRLEKKNAHPVDRNDIDRRSWGLILPCLRAGW